VHNDPEVPEGGTLGLGVIGCGYWGPNLVRNFGESRRARVTAIADLRPERLAAMRGRAPEARTTTSHRELIEDPAVDAVAITTPVSTHFDLARQALEAGKHVLVAKPLTSTSAESEQLIALAAERNLVLMVDHTFVYTGAVAKIKQLLDDGSLGELLYVDSVRVNLGLFQHDVNVIWDLAAHDFSILAHLIDQPPLTVSATGASHSGSGLEDVAYVTLRYPNDLIAHCHLNWLSPVKIRQTLIGGSERMLVWNDLAADEKVKVYDKGITVGEPGDPDYYAAAVSYRIGDAWIPQLARHEALALEADHFIDCILNGARPITGGEAGRDVVRLLEATSASLREGGRPIDLETRRPAEAMR
jgi:predicted dehydrogenase